MGIHISENLTWSGEIQLEFGKIILAKPVA
jgi:hypothetical protein